MPRPILLLLAVSLLIPACTPGSGRVRLGAETSAEQAVLAQVAKQLIEDRTRLRVAIVPCGDTYDCGQAMMEQRIDLLIEYSGSAYVYSGRAPATHSGTLDDARRLHTPAGFTWLDALGFESGYRLVMPTDRAVALGMTSIADLATFAEGVRMAAPTSYIRRPGDGLSALLHRHGLRLRGTVLVLDNAEERLRVLRNGQADVIVVRSTNGFLRNLSLTSLKDTLGFFPPYEAAVVARTSVLETHPPLSKTLALLHDQFSREVMQQLNFEVEVEGWTPAVVAHQFLRDTELITETRRAWSRKPEIVIAVDEADQFGPLTPEAIRAVRTVYPGYPVRLLPTSVPVREVANGRAKLALLGAERFFRGQGANRFSRRDDRIEAAAIVGTRFLHIARRRHEEPLTPPLSGRVGVPLPGSGSARVAMGILEDNMPDIFDVIEGLLDRVAKNDLDAALFFEVPGSSEVAKALADRQLVLRSLDAPPADLPPFLRPTRIPSETYVGQVEPVDTVSLQVVIAGAAPASHTGLQAGGPAGAMRSRRSPVAYEEANALGRALEMTEPPTPVLPSVWRRRAETSKYLYRSAQAQSVLDTLLSVAVILFLVWAVALAMHHPQS
ncbi:MAG: hypothetical protein OEU26_13410 [Candidatus Tectomicrobia bacterium]|nr:hypothetical protein [Candidatus Tectomicrobia bacterium]